MNNDSSKNCRGIFTNSSYSAPWWLPGGHLQTIYARSLAGNYQIDYRRERWETPDGDFIDLDWCDSGAADSKLLVLFHGLEGCSRSHYALSAMAAAQRQGWRGVVPHFRGCAGEANRLARSYHSGDSDEIDWILRRLKARNPEHRIYAVGVSLGGNVLLKWLGEQGDGAAAIVERAVAVSAPVDLQAAADGLDRSWNRLLYTRHFLKTIKQKAQQKMPTLGLQLNADALRAASTFRQFDDAYTAPVHGFKDAIDYWQRSSAKPWLKRIKIATLVLNARNDPFLPANVLPTREDVSDAVTLEYPASGGHVGFVSGSFPGDIDWLPRRILDYLTG